MTGRPITIDDLFEMKLVDEPVVDPQCRRVVFTVTTLDRADNRYRASIWSCDIATQTLAQLTSGRFRDAQPRWSPDGTSIAFLSDRAEEFDSAPQVFLLPMSGGEPRQVTHHRYGVDGFEWSPDGHRMLFSASQPHPIHSAAQADSDVRVITSARYRADGAGYLDDRFKQIFVIAVDGGTARQLTDGPYDHQQPTWAPHGYEIAFASNRRANWEFSSVRDIYVVKSESGHVRQLTDGTGRWSQPSWSPDGRAIAAYGTYAYKTEGARNEIFVITVADGENRAATANLDIDFRDSSISDWNGYALDRPTWLEDGRILSVAGIGGEVRPTAVDLASGQFEYLAESSGRFGHVRPLADSNYVAVRSDFANPGELVTIDANGAVSALTEFNTAWAQSVTVASPQSLTVTSPDGVEIESWLIKPPGIQEGEKAPLLLEIHGGPFGMYCNTFMHEFQVLAAQGYGVLFANPRGSAGYGDGFAQSLLPAMGERDMPDLMAAVDRALQESWVDPERLGVLGGSYGGFMTNWIVSHTDRFRAAVTQRTVSNWHSAWGTDDIFYGDENATFGATPWEQAEIFFRYSPISYVERISTPLLILHSEQDYRCPIAQSEELFIALKRLGRTAEFVRFPDEGHGLSRTGKPVHRVERLQHILRWFDLHLFAGLRNDRPPTGQ